MSPPDRPSSRRSGIKLSRTTRTRSVDLRPEEREAIIARVEIGYSYEELAEALGKPSAEAARKTARRALLRLAEEMNRGLE